MLFGDNSEAARAAVEAAKEAVRSTANFDWTFIALLALVVCGVYVPQIKRTGTGSRRPLRFTAYTGCTRSATRSSAISGTTHCGR